MVSLKIKNKSIKNEKITIDIDAQYRGNGKVRISLSPISGVKGYNPELTCKYPEGRIVNYKVPENFETMMDKNSELLHLTLKLDFKGEAEPKYKVPVLKLGVFIIYLPFVVGDKTRTKRIIIFRR